MVALIWLGVGGGGSGGGSGTAGFWSAQSPTGGKTAIPILGLIPSARITPPS